MMIPLLLPQILALAAATFAWLFPWHGWSKETHDLMQTLNDKDDDHSHISAGELKEAVTKLPTVVQQWINAVLNHDLNDYDNNEDIPFSRSLRISQEGEFLLNGKFIDFTATQEFSTRAQHAGFVWDANMTMMDCIGLKLPIHVRDAYVSGMGMLKAQMPFGLPVMRMEDSPELNEGELLRWCSEAVLFPLALVWMEKSEEQNSTLKWHSSDVDENAAIFEFNHAGTNIRLHFKFDPVTHLVTSMHCMRPRMVGTRTERAFWEAYCFDYERRGGMLVPTRMECGWKLDTQKEVEIYFKGNNEHFIYLMS
eukprot:scaffold495_cov152-Skeletonema_menzelii.AAC.12